MLKFILSKKRLGRLFALMLCSAMVLSACVAQGNVPDDNSGNVSDDPEITADGVSEPDVPDVPDIAGEPDDVLEDYSDQINAEGNGYELDGRVSSFPIVIGEHEHPECDDTDAELMALGQEKFSDAVKLYKVIMCLTPRDRSKVIYDEYGNEIYAMDEEFGTYESIMELCENTFAPGAGDWGVYFSVEHPEELLDSGLVGLEVDDEYIPPRPITEALDWAMEVENGVTYLVQNSSWDTHKLQTKVIGVMNHTDTHIEYRLCTMVLDESAEALAVSEEIPQVFFEHSVMKLDFIDGKWLITQMRQFVGNEENNSYLIDTYNLEF